MKLNKIILSAFVFMGLAVSSSVMAKHSHGAKNMYRLLLSDRAAEFVDLTESQREQIKAIAKAEKALVKSFKAEHKENRQAMKEMVQAPTFDEQGFRDALAVNQAQRTELAVTKAKNKNKVWNLLTEEQQQKVVELKDKIRKKMKKRRNKV